MFRRPLTFVLLALAAVSGLQASEIAPGVDLLPGRFVRGEQPDGNTVLLRGETGLIVVDTGRHTEHTQAIVDYAKQAKLPIAAIVNTHWHLDHISGNAMLRRVFPGVRIYASDALAAAQRGFLATYRAQLADAVAKTSDAAQRASWEAEMARIDAGAQLAPDEVVTASGERRIAGRALDLRLTDHAVTAADLWLRDEKSRVVVAGDLVTLPVPLFDTACPAHWQEALGQLANADFDVLVPGHGALMDRKRFATYRKAFDHLLSCAASKQEKGACIDGWMQDASGLLTGEDPAWVRSMLDYYLDKSLRGDAAHRAELCGN